LGVEARTHERVPSTPRVRSAAESSPGYWDGSGKCITKSANLCDPWSYVQPLHVRVADNVSIHYLPSVDLPSDRKVVRAADLARAVNALARAGTGRVVHVGGAGGSFSAVLARTLALADARPIVCVTADVEAARKLVDDLNFVWGSRSTETAQGDVLFFAPPDASPYADVNPDRRGAMARLVTLFHLARKIPWRFLVVPAAGLESCGSTRLSTRRSTAAGVVTFKASSTSGRSTRHCQRWALGPPARDRWATGLSHSGLTCAACQALRTSS